MDILIQYHHAHFKRAGREWTEQKTKGNCLELR